MSPHHCCCPGRFTWVIFVLYALLTMQQNDTVAANWPLFTPVLLTLLDDPDTQIRCQGLAALHAFLGKLPAETLRNTGLASLFEDAVFPTLLFLPSMTPEAESVQLLRPAYAVLLALAERHAAASSAAHREKMLDRCSAMACSPPTSIAENMRALSRARPADSHDRTSNGPTGRQTPQG